MTTILKANNSVFNLTENTNFGAKRVGKQLMKYLRINPDSQRTPLSNVPTEKEEKTNLKTLTKRGTKIQFETRRHWQLKEWK